jgi:phosphate uptake regulator
VKRSVIQLAGRTLLVSLPSKWVDAQGIKKGDEVDVLEDGHRLVINTEPNSAIESVELDADALGSLHLIRRYVFALYKKGIDEIKIKYSDPKTADAVRDTILNETVGYEIVSQTPKSCVVKLITSGGITEFDNLLRRTFLLLLTMSEESLTTIKSGNFEHLAKTALLEKTNNRLTIVCRRSLNKVGSDTYNKVGPLYYIVEEMENLGDEYKYLCQNLTRLEDKKSRDIRPEIINLLERANTSLRLFYELFYKFDVHKYDQVGTYRNQIIDEAHDLVDKKKLTPAEFYALHHAILIVDRIFCMMGPHLVLLKGIAN